MSTSAARAILVILLGLTVTCWRVRHRPVSSATPRSPRQRTARSSALRVRVLMSEFGAVCGLRHRGVHSLTCALVAGVGEGGQSLAGRGVQRAEAVFAGSGQVVDRAGLDLRDPDREPVGTEQSVDVAAEIMSLTGVPGIDRRALRADLLDPQPVGVHDRAVENDMRPALVVTALQRIVQVRGASGEHTEGLVEVSR